MCDRTFWWAQGYRFDVPKASRHEVQTPSPNMAHGGKLETELRGDQKTISIHDKGAIHWGVDARETASIAVTTTWASTITFQLATCRDSDQPFFAALWGLIHHCLRGHHHDRGPAEGDTILGTDDSAASASIGWTTWLGGHPLSTSWMNMVEKGSDSGQSTNLVPGDVLDDSVHSPTYLQIAHGKTRQFKNCVLVAKLRIVRCAPELVPGGFRGALRHLRHLPQWPQYGIRERIRVHIAVHRLLLKAIYLFFSAAAALRGGGPAWKAPVILGFIESQTTGKIRGISQCGRT
ncbi:hypothetical protein F5I97DRAFT_2076039 [Phlebopus sp. FC_14]|nr:hypothetical protein F5I97DRAFT_2076039 [Phlebopus sp. FC_14]